MSQRNKNKPRLGSLIIWIDITEPDKNILGVVCGINPLVYSVFWCDNNSITEENLSYVNEKLSDSGSNWKLLSY